MTLKKSSTNNKKPLVSSIVEHILGSFAQRVRVVGEVMKETTALLKRLSLEQAEMALRLRDTLAQKQSLRKRDFDHLLEDIVLRNLDKRKRIHEALTSCQNEAEGMIARFRDALTGAKRTKLSEFRSISREILDRLDRKEREIGEALRSFHIEQEEFAAGLRKLVEKGDRVRTKDFRTVVGSLRRGQLERESEIGELLNAFGRVQEEVKSRWEKVFQGY